MSQHLPTSFGSIAYMESAGGPEAVVFLHTNSGCKEIFSKQFSGDLAERHRLVAIDLPGHGESDDAADPQGTYTIGRYGELVNEICTGLEIARPVLVGCSLGGHIAIEAATRRPDFFRGLVIAGSPPIGPGLEAVARAFLPSEHMQLTGQEHFSTDEARQYARATFGKEELISDALLAAVVRTDGRARATMLGDWMSHPDAYPQAGFVEAWESPVCVIHGRQDPFVSLDYLRSLQWRNLWSGEIQVLDTGHVPYIANPAACNELLSRFLQDLQEPPG